MFIMAVAPNKQALWATNGLLQTSVSIACATGLGMSTSLFAFLVQHNMLGGHGVYIVFICLTCFSLVFTAWLPDGIYLFCLS
jgi:hypothetical protein